MVDEKDYYGQQPAIAYLLEKDYNNKVFTTDQYLDFRKKHTPKVLNGNSELKRLIRTVSYTHLDVYKRQCLN